MSGGLETALAQLGQLSEEDRDWILERLPREAKAKLLGAGNQRQAPRDPTLAPATAEKANDGPLTTLYGFDATVVAAALRPEPSWAAAVLLQGSQAEWAKSLLNALPVTMRGEVERIRAHGTRFTAQIVDAVARLTLARLQEVEQPHASKFAKLVERFSAARARKRLLAFP